MIQKKKKPVDIIQATSLPELEHAFYKFPGKEIVDISIIERSTHTFNRSVPVTSRKHTYMHIHTHPSALPNKHIIKQNPETYSRTERILSKVFPKFFETEIIENYAEIDYSALPSGGDMKSFLEDKKEKSSVIVVREPETGIVRGYTIVRKTKLTPSNIRSSQIEKDVDIYRRDRTKEGMLYPSFVELAKTYHLQHKFMPADGYVLNAAKSQFVKKKNLEKIVSALISILGLMSCISFLEQGMTGSVVGRASSSVNICIGLFFLGICMLSLIFFSKSIKN